MASKFSFEIYTSSKNLPIGWDSLVADNIFLSRDYLSVLESSAPANLYCHFIGLFLDDQLVGAALSQFINLSEVSSFGERDHCLKTLIRNFVFKNLSSKVLVIGNNMLTGQNSYCFDEKLPITEGLILLEKASEELKSIFNLKGLKTHLTIFKDFENQEIQNFKIQEYNSFFEFSTQPNMVFDIKESWNLFDDYINALSKKYRDQYKRAEQKSCTYYEKKIIPRRNYKIQF